MPKNDTKFKVGNPGGPGRPKGSRHKLGEEFIAALCADFTKHGEKAIKKLQELSPGEYLRVIASILPKDINISQDIVHTVINAQPALTTDEWQTKHSKTQTI